MRKIVVVPIIYQPTSRKNQFKVTLTRPQFDCLLASSSDPNEAGVPKPKWPTHNPESISILFKLPASLKFV